MKIRIQGNKKGYRIILNCTQNEASLIRDAIDDKVNRREDDDTDRLMLANMNAKLWEWV